MIIYTEIPIGPWRKPVIIVSACLLGFRCRYDGTSCPAEGLLERRDPRTLIPVCPEQMGGLSTPREPATLSGGDGGAVLDGKARVITRASCKDWTAPFLAGAEAVVRAARLAGAKEAILKERSPSCGVKRTYVDKVLLPGQGVAAAALARAGVTVIPEGI